MRQNDHGSFNQNGFSSSDSVIIILDGPGDTTVRPLRPLRGRRRQCGRVVGGDGR